MNEVQKPSKKKKVIVLCLIFLFALSLRLWNINKMGRAWDEAEYVEPGYRLIELLKKGDFDNSYFYTTYNHPPFVKYLYGLTSHFDIEAIKEDSTPIFRYDYTFSRTLSAIVSSFSVVVVVLIGWSIGSRFTGIAAGVILSTIPFFLGLSQLVSTESFVMLFFSASFYSFLLLLQKFSFKKILITGIITGFALQVKQSNALLFPIFVFAYSFWYWEQKSKNKNIRYFNYIFFSIFYIFLISFIIFVLIWPTVIFHFSDIYSIHKELWHVTFSPNIWQITLSPPEVFFGRLMMTPIFYYLVYFLITVPIIILAFFYFGVNFIYQKKSWVLSSILIWFSIPFMMSFYSWRQHGLRYIVQVYAPLSLIAALGYESFIQKFTKKEVYKYYYFIPVLLYSFLILFRTTPYYLDYFNLFVGGTKGVYENSSFQIGWWGQGIREAGLYVLTHAKKGSRIGLALSPSHVFPPAPGMNVSLYRKEETYDFVVVNYYNILRERFDDTDIRKKYKPVYFVKANGAILVYVYKN